MSNNGGGHANHSLFWTVMSPQGGGPSRWQAWGGPSMATRGLRGAFGCVPQAAADPLRQRLGTARVTPRTLAGGERRQQDSPLMNGNTPILGLDVWGARLYLKYQNRRRSASALSTT
ncbi:Fe-Mn family superoxide dismutase [Pseudomonas aeruginosa]